MTEEKELTIEAVIDYLKGENCSDIRSTVEGFEDPKEISIKTSEDAYTPDITAQAKSKVILMDVLDPNAELEDHKNRWSVFSAEAKKSTVDFYIVAMNFMEHTVLNFINENKIKAKVFTVGISG